MVMVPLVALLYVLTILTTGMSGVSVAAKAAARDAMNGKQPKPYFGIKGTLMCVTPVSGDASVYNGPLPKGRPVLTFGVSNGRLWLWDGTGQASRRAQADHARTALQGLHIGSQWKRTNLHCT